MMAHLWVKFYSKLSNGKMGCKKLFFHNLFSILTNNSYEEEHIDNVIKRLLWGYDGLYREFRYDVRPVIQEVLRHREVIPREDRDQQERSPEHITDSRQPPSENGGQKESDLVLELFSRNSFSDHNAKDTCSEPTRSDVRSGFDAELNVAHPPSDNLVGNVSRSESLGHGASRSSLERAITKSEHEDSTHIDIEESAVEERRGREPKTETEAREQIE